MNLSFKNRMAWQYMLATAVLVLLFSALLYFVVELTVYKSLDKDLSFEARKHTTEIEIVANGIHFINKEEWEEHEHKEAQVNPVFIQIIGVDGKLMDKSPNLKEQFLLYNESKESGQSFNTQLNSIQIRQIQIPIMVGAEKKGYVLAAMSSESINTLLNNLRTVLFISLPLMLLALFVVSRFLAGRNIIPIKNIIETTDRISKSNLSERVRLPLQKDELFDLSESINGLLARIENALEREKQFTSDASHELRTPLASIRGNLEVLIRKERSVTEYIDNIQYSLSEIDQMSNTLDQLMTLARLDKGMRANDAKREIGLIIEESIEKYIKLLAEKSIGVDFQSANLATQLVSYGHTSLVVDNLISNAIKYSNPDSSICIKLALESSNLELQIIDEGLGIKEADLHEIFSAFYRSDSLNHKHIKGNGLGLSIVKKACESMGASISVSSELGKGSVFTLKF